VSGGNNRQLDLLVVDMKADKQYHVETSVMPGFLPSTAELGDLFDKKFRGAPAQNDKPRGDFIQKKGPKFKKAIEDTYCLYGFDPTKVNRVWVTWAVKDPKNLPSFLEEYEKKNGVRVEVKSLCDVIIPELQDKVGAANYDDEVLRTLSLLKQRGSKAPPSA
jgi:hypothetical protein